jgi:murein DD-endopeptidase MepM/ murein hydrolase activator NlpD
MAIDRLSPINLIGEHLEKSKAENLHSFKGPGSEASRELELKRAAKEFESLFIYEMLKAMRKTIPEDGLFQGMTGKDTYTAIMDQQLASAMAERGGLGIADIIYRQMMPTIKEGRQLERQFAPPLQGVVSSAFGMRTHPLLGYPMYHHGVDIASPAGTEIRAVAQGQVIFSGWLPNYGNTVMVEHAGGYVSLYAHNESNDVQVDQGVKQGQAIARVGSTGRSTGPHLHFELRLLGNPVDPRVIMVAGSENLSKNT